MSRVLYIVSSDEAHIPLPLDGPVGLDARSCCVRNSLPEITLPVFDIIRFR